MQNTPSSTPAHHDIEVLVTGAEEASFGVAEFWSGGRQIAFTCLEEGELTFRIVPCPDEVVVGAHALAEALQQAKRLLERY